MEVFTGTPSLIPGLNLIFFAASTAAALRPKSFSMPRAREALLTSPCSSMVMETMTVPETA